MKTKKIVINGKGISIVNSDEIGKPLKDFMYECINGNDIFFVSSEEEAVEKLGRV